MSDKKAKPSSGKKQPVPKKAINKVVVTAKTRTAAVGDGPNDDVPTGNPDPVNTGNNGGVSSGGNGGVTSGGNDDVSSGGGGGVSS
jgi:hypothetical protein